jgi:hypothetical protein
MLSVLRNLPNEISPCTYIRDPKRNETTHDFCLKNHAKSRNTSCLASSLFREIKSFAKTGNPNSNHEMKKLTVTFKGILL